MYKVYTTDAFSSGPAPPAAVTTPGDVEEGVNKEIDTPNQDSPEGTGSNRSNKKIIILIGAITLVLAAAVGVVLALTKPKEDEKKLQIDPPYPVNPDEQKNDDEKLEVDPPYPIDGGNTDEVDLYVIDFVAHVSPFEDEEQVWEDWEGDFHDRLLLEIGSEESFQWSYTYMPESTSFEIENDNDFDDRGSADMVDSADMVEAWTVKLEDVDTDTGVARVSIGVLVTVNDDVDLGLATPFVCSQDWTMTHEKLSIANENSADYEPPTLICDFGDAGKWGYKTRLTNVQIYVPPPKYTVDIFQYYAWSSTWTSHSFGPVEYEWTTGAIEVGETWLEEDYYEVIIRSIDESSGVANVEVTSLRSSCRTPNSFQLAASVDSGTYGPSSDNESCYGSNDINYTERMKIKINTAENS